EILTAPVHAPAAPEPATLSLHDALPICLAVQEVLACTRFPGQATRGRQLRTGGRHLRQGREGQAQRQGAKQRLQAHGGSSLDEWADIATQRHMVQCAKHEARHCPDRKRAAQGRRGTTAAVVRQFRAGASSLFEASPAAVSRRTSSDGRPAWSIRTMLIRSYSDSAIAVVAQVHSAATIAGTVLLWPATRTVPERCRAMSRAASSSAGRCAS